MRITVAGRSMLPLLHPGDVLLVRPGRRVAVEVGAVVTLLDRGSPVTHRVVTVDGELVLTKGDHAPNFDPPAPLGAVFGRVVACGERTLIVGAWARGIARVSRWEGELDRRLSGQAGRIVRRLAHLPFRVTISLLVYLSAAFER